MTTQARTIEDKMYKWLREAAKPAWRAKATVTCGSDRMERMV